MTDEGDGRATLQDVFAVMRDPDLSAEEKVLWGIIRSHETPEKGAYPGDERLARMMDKSPRSVERYRRSLLERGYLEQQLRGPKPATYRAVLPEDRSDTGGDSSPERNDTSGDPSSPGRSDTNGEASKGSPKDSPKGSPPVSPEYGEYGEETDTEGSSLRSSPSGEAGDVENHEAGEGSAAALSREELLEAGPRAVGARFGPVLRETLYQPDGRPPENYDDGRDVEIIRGLLERGYGPERLELALAGLAHERDAGRLESAGPGQKLTARILKSEVAGRRDPVSRFENVGRRVLAGELDGANGQSRPSGDGPTAIGDILGRLDSDSGHAAAEDGP